jgi:hypothetical protein
MNFIVRYEQTKKHYTCVEYCPSTGVYTTTLSRLNGAEYVTERTHNYSSRKSALACYYRYRREAQNEEI